ncbi:MAG: hypothetical protein M0Z51_12650 [Propionibacterium sp.]|nr:hypothetical protein [Propionibacterium sp.]
MTIQRPGVDEMYVAGQPVVVVGIVVGDGNPEPSEADAVTVSADGGAPVQATLAIVPGQHTAPTKRFTATVPVTDTLGFHTIVAEATFDNQSHSRAAVTMIRGEAGAPAKTPAASLEVMATNPGPPSTGDEDWAVHIVKGNRTPPIDVSGVSVLTLAAMLARGDDFPVCSREWNEITAPGEDYDDDPVAFSGWLLQPEISGNDVPFTHPFGNDWECMVALDPVFSGLLAQGNTVDDGADGTRARADADSLGITIPPGGIMAVEDDGGCVPLAFNPLLNLVRVGDRIAALGRWIVDAGHSVPVGEPVPPLNLQFKSYRAEVHPPMLLAIAGTRTTAAGDVVTRLLLTSRPFLARQVYATDTDTIQNDGAPDDGGLLWHLNSEIQKLGVSHTTIEAHPKIAEKPFRGVHFLRLRVRPPAPGGPVGPILAGGEIEVSFQVTHRSAVGVEVVPADDGVDVLLALNSVDYKPFPLPERETVSITKDELGDASALITLEQFLELIQLNVVDTVIAEKALSDGVQTDRYAVPGVDVLDRSHAVPFVPISAIPSPQGIVVDDGQPYPVFGFLELRRHRVDVVTGATGAATATGAPGGGGTTGVIGGAVHPGHPAPVGQLRER